MPLVCLWCQNAQNEVLHCKRIRRVYKWTILMCLLMYVTCLWWQNQNLSFWCVSAWWKCIFLTRWHSWIMSWLRFLSWFEAVSWRIKDPIRYILHLIRKTKERKAKNRQGGCKRKIKGAILREEEEEVRDASNNDSSLMENQGMYFSNNILSFSILVHIGWFAC